MRHKIPLTVIQDVHQLQQNHSDKSLFYWFKSRLQTISYVFQASVMLNQLFSSTQFISYHQEKPTNNEKMQDYDYQTAFYSSLKDMCLSIGLCA